jgi:hypothetical protein
LTHSFEARGLSRRELLAAGAALAVWPLVGRAESGGVAGPLRSALETSEFVYITPRKSDGAESTCHGEVWYGWLDDAVVIITSTQAWKARALTRGLDGARIWAGNHGRWKGLIFRNEDFRKAPSFEARGSIARDPALLEQLLALYETKYPAEIADWRERMRSGYADGSRVLIRYVPAA